MSRVGRAADVRASSDADRLVRPRGSGCTPRPACTSGSYAFVGSAEAEMKARDAVTGQLLGAAIDKRAGGMALSSAAQWQWGDAENAMNYWARKITNRLLELQGRATSAK
ncbi:MAG: DUF3313 family protein [Candidatus Binataceae bacterium]